jgi:hypothetical protein
LELKFDLDRSIIYSMKNILACIPKNERTAIECQRKDRKVDITTSFSKQGFQSLEENKELKTLVIDVVVLALRKKKWWFGVNDYEFCCFSVMFFTSLMKNNKEYIYIFDNVKRWTFKDTHATTKPKRLKVGIKYCKEDCVFMYQYASLPICSSSH